MRLAVVKMPYTGSRNMPERSTGPDHVESGGLLDRLRDEGADVGPVETISLSAAEDRDAPGTWHRMGLACGHLADSVARHLHGGRRVVGLLGNCTSMLGMLGGLRAVTGGAPIGLLWIDAHADFNTPETTLSGMLGGMPVAVAAGLCLHRLRAEACLDPPIAAGDIVMAGLRDVDPLEQALLDEHGVEQVPVEAIEDAMTRLARRTGTVYIHVDMDVLDPAEVAGHPLTVPGGPSSEALAAELARIFTRPKAVALGIASTPPVERDGECFARAAAHRLVAAVVGR